MDYKPVYLSPETQNALHKLANIRSYLRPYIDGFLTSLFTFLTHSIQYKY